MKRWVIFLLALTVFFTIAPITQVANVQGMNYQLLKAEYIRNHPGQSIIPFPWEPTTSTKVLPFNYIIPAAPANSLSLAACRNQFESASFVITAQKDLSGIGITVPNLYSAQGNSIPADAINVRLVKAWYQAGEGTPENGFSITNTGVRVLAPELLLKDDSLVNVDYVNKINYLKVTINGVQQYIVISNPSGTFPSNAQIQDAHTLQPFSLTTNENKQIWLTVHVPANTPSGDYEGDIAITTPSEAPVLMNVKVTVLPFDLEPSPVEYSLFYRGMIPSTTKGGIDSEWKTPQQYALELQNMKEHGIAYPTIYQWDDSMLGTALSLRKQSGLPTDHIYSVGILAGNYATYGRLPDPLTSDKDLADLAKNVVKYKDSTSSYGFGDLYLYGFDEYGGDLLRSERPAWMQVHKSGAKVFASSWSDSELIEIVGDILDVAVLGANLNKTQATLWHNYGHKVFLYNQPQVGIENPKIYRQNYGFALWNAGYDGAMDYAYQQGFGQSIWNDFDHDTYRDHVFAYPTSNGVIDTIQWEGFREGVDDTRYLATSMKHGLSASSARSIIADSLSKGEDMAIIREKVINQILISQH
jgi:hypothetical protein